MRGFGGGLKPLEIGISAAKAAGNTITDNAKQMGQVAKSQFTNKPLQSQTPMQQPKMPDSLGNFGGLFETNQVPQNQSPATSQQAPPQPVNLEEKYRPQKIEDQNALAAARRNLQELEAEMKRIKEEREKKWAEMNQQEEQEQKQEDMWKKQEEKQKPVTAGSKQEGGGKKG